MSLPLDTGAVGRWLEKAVPGLAGPWTARKFATGQSNPTYLLEGPGGRLVLRRKPPGRLLRSAHAIEREYRVQKALEGSAVPVPRMIALCEDDSVIGSPFYVMSHVPGRAFLEPTMPGETPATRSAVAAEMNRVLAAIHEVDIARRGLADFGPPGNYLERQTARWTRQYRATETEPLPDMDALISGLPRALPPDDGQRSLVHGDFRIDNLLFSEQGGRCVAVLDWELSTIGHPFADLAAVIMQWQLPPGPLGRGLEGLDRAALGLPSDAEFVAAYAARRGLAEIRDLHVWLAFSFFRMAAILQGVKKRGLDGNASNPEQAAALGRFVPVFARKGLEALEGELRIV